MLGYFTSELCTFNEMQRKCVHNKRTLTTVRFIEAGFKNIKMRLKNIGGMGQIASEYGPVTRLCER
jgi:hypothetical protein